MHKQCPHHGKFSAMVERDPVWYGFCKSLCNSYIYNGYMLDITDRCNIQCKYCYHRNGVEDKGVEDIVKEALLCHKLVPFILSGGEPTMHPELPKILKLLSSIGETIIITNGIKLCNESYMESLIAAGIKEKGEVLRVGLSFHPESKGKDIELLHLCRKKGYKLGSGLYVINSMEQLDQAVEVYKEYADVLSTFRIKAASRVWNEQKPESTIFVSDMIAHLEKSGKVEIDVNSSNHKVSFAGVNYNGLNIKLVSWYNVGNIDLPDINCPPYYRAKDGNIYHMLTAFILNERVK
jgi:uncharacterized radical SAM superfamily Fe-S cluster-containing enzyme